MKVNWKGIYPAVTTKFTANNKLDQTAFEKNIRSLLEAGVNGIILGGTLGEARSLDEEEKYQLIHITRQTV